MTPFKLAVHDVAGARRNVEVQVREIMADRAFAVRVTGKEDVTEQDVRDIIVGLTEHNLTLPVYRNDKYQVLVDAVPDLPDGWPDMVYLTIRRLDRDIIRDWRDLQEIKNMLVGEENEGVELFPAESRLVDSANQYHLFVIKDPNVRFPFGFKQRNVTGVSGANTRQRPFNSRRWGIRGGEPTRID